ncbi:hypothetical protein O1611_g9488 [Lasiodiplodia mahajangana]|uniref:Uncharacterized protein n=1 Tax=Lasiodiplodia mahajangana TaxID=1108764 RepID=A0ACC2J970_9PEZI|nr:hypothetical protein O1611_g9488 [Lasiodiplodia mahajangana]
MTTAALFLVDLAYLVPMTYIPSYYLDRQGLPGDKTLSGDAAFAYQLLAIANGSSCFGRYVAGALGDRFGHYNTLIVSLFFCLTSVAGFWLPDALAPRFDSIALLVLFTILFGFVSGSNVSLTPICLGQLCQIQDYGKYYATCYTVCSFGCLISIPIAGSLLDATDATGKQRYWGAVVYTATRGVYSVPACLWIAIRRRSFSVGLGRTVMGTAAASSDAYARIAFVDYIATPGDSMNSYARLWHDAPLSWWADNPFWQAKG